MRDFILLVALTALVTVCSFWATYGVLSLAEWLGQDNFSFVIAGWSGFQFLVVGLLGLNKSRSH